MSTAGHGALNSRVCFSYYRKQARCVFIPLSVSLSRFWVRLCVTNRILSLKQNKKKTLASTTPGFPTGQMEPLHRSSPGGWYACSLHIVLRVLAGDRLCWKLQPRQERGQKGPLRTVWTDFTVNAKSVRPLFFFKGLVCNLNFIPLYDRFRNMLICIICNQKPKTQMERQNVLLLPHYLDFNIVHLHFPLIPTRDIFQY